MSKESDIWMCPQCRTAVDTSEQGVMSEIACPHCGTVAVVHTRLQNLQLEQVIGVGGMSVVLQARDMVLDRLLAVKVLNEDYRNTPERVARFEKECALMARVRHPNVVSVYSAGVEHGQFYIAMEMVEGQNLEMMVSPEKPMSPLQALSIVRQVAKGLHAANRAGVLHRDIKPGNILVTRKGRAKVLDFGLSLGKTDSDTEETIWATPFYVPPETLLRENEDVRTDIYALGMTLRFLLAGRETFDGNPQTIKELLACKKKLAFPRNLYTKLDEAYADLIAHMTAFDINARPVGYVDLLQEMDEVRLAQKAYEKAQSAVGKTRRWGARVLLVGAVAFAGGMIAWESCRFFTPPPEPDALIFSARKRALMPDDLKLNAAEQALNEGHLQNSADQFVALARDAADPTMGAWGAMMALYFSHYAGVELNREEIEGLFRKHLEDDSNISPAGRAGMQEIRTWAALCEGALHPDAVSKPDNPVLLALGQVAAAKNRSLAHDKIGTQVHLEKAIEAMDLLPAPYNKLTKIPPTPETCDKSHWTTPFAAKWGNASAMNLATPQRSASTKDVPNLSKDKAPSAKIIRPRDLSSKLAKLTDHEAARSHVKQQGILPADYDAELISRIKRRDDETATALVTLGAKLNLADDVSEKPLLLAAKYGNSYLVYHMLKKGADVNCTDNPRNSGKSALGAMFYAAAGNNAETVQLLEAQGLNPNQRDCVGWTPLHHAAKHGSVEVAKLLVEKYGAATNAQTTSGQTPVFAASMSGHIKMIEYLISVGADVNHVSRAGHTAIMWAASQRHDDCVRYLIDVGSDVNACKLPHGKGEPHNVAKSCGVDTVQYMWEKGGNFALEDKSGENAAFYAAEGKNKPVLRWLISKGLRVKNLDRIADSQMREYVRRLQADRLTKEEEANLLKDLSPPNPRLSDYEKLRNKDAAVRYLNKQRIYPSAYDSELVPRLKKGELVTAYALVSAGATLDRDAHVQEKPFLVAAQYGDAALVKLMAEKGADYNCTDKPQNAKQSVSVLNAMYYAAAGNKVDIIHFLANQGLDPLQEDRVGWTPLHHACKHGSLEAAHLLIELYRADANAQTGAGTTPLFAACSSGTTMLAQYLIEQGANIRQVPRSGHTLITWAALQRNNDLVRFFADNGCDVKACHFKDGSGVPHWVARYCDLDTVRYLWEKGADFAKTDNNGENAVDYAAKANRTDNVKFFNSKGLRANSTSNQSYQNQQESQHPDNAPSSVRTNMVASLHTVCRDNDKLNTNADYYVVVNLSLSDYDNPELMEPLREAYKQMKRSGRVELILYWGGRNYKDYAKKVARYMRKNRLKCPYMLGDDVAKIDKAELGELLPSGGSISIVDKNGDDVGGYPGLVKRVLSAWEKYTIDKK